MWKWGPQQQRLDFSTVQIDTVGNRERVLYCRIIHLQLVVGKTWEMGIREEGVRSMAHSSKC
jgi:hypothetical protein